MKENIAPDKPQASASILERLVMRLPVAGAGEFVIDITPGSVTRCGKAKGCSIGVTWGSYGEAGGVMDTADLKKLANGINTWLEEYDRTCGA